MTLYDAIREWTENDAARIIMRGTAKVNGRRRKDPFYQVRAADRLEWKDNGVWMEVTLVA